MKKYEEVLSTNYVPVPYGAGWILHQTVKVWWAKKPNGIRCKERTEERNHGLISRGSARKAGLVD